MAGGGEGGKKKQSGPISTADNSQGSIRSEARIWEPDRAREN